MTHSLAKQSAGVCWEIRSAEQIIFMTRIYANRCTGRMALNRVRWALMESKLVYGDDADNMNFPCVAFTADAGNAAYRFVVYARNGRLMGESATFESALARDRAYGEFMRYIQEIGANL